MIYNGQTPTGHKIFLVGEKLDTNKTSDIYGFMFLGFIKAPVTANFMLDVPKGLNEKEVLDRALEHIETDENEEI